MEACAQGGAASACAAFESWQAGATLFELRLPPFPSLPYCAARHATTAHLRHAQWLIRRCTPPPSRETEVLTAWRRRLLRPGSRMGKSFAGGVRGWPAGTGCDHIKTTKSR